jgi:hypothetical protein
MANDVKGVIAHFNQDGVYDKTVPIEWRRDTQELTSWSNRVPPNW